MDQDLQHLKLLSIFHYVFGGLMAFFGCFPFIYVVLGVVFIVNPEAFETPNEGPPPAFLGWFFIAFGFIFIAIGWTIAALIIAAGRFLGKRTRYVFCIVVAVIECFMVPLGTILGVFTIVVLMRDWVKDLFYTDAGNDPFRAESV